jgi:RecG-like helicase
MPKDREQGSRGPGDGSRRGSQTVSADGEVPALRRRERTEVVGRVHTIEIKPVGQSSILACTITAAGGELTALFYGRTNIPGLGPGSNVRLRGSISSGKTGTVMINPAYELTD